MDTPAPRASGQRRVLSLIFVTVVIDLIGFGIVIPLLPLYSERYGAGPLEIGAIMGIFSGCQLLFAPVFGRLSDRFGRRPILLMSMIGAAIGYAIMGFAQSFEMLMAARVLQGVSGASIATAQAAIADVTSQEDRAKGMGLIGAAFGIGFVLGPLIGGLMSLVSLGAPFFFAAGVSVVNAALLYWRLPETRPAAKRGSSTGTTPGVALSIGECGRTLRLLMAAYLLAITGFSVMTGMFSLFTKDRFGFDEAANGYIFAYIGFIAIVIQGRLIGPLVRRFGEKPLALAGAALVAVSLFGLPLAPTVAMLLVATAGLAVGNSLIMPTLNSMTSRCAPPETQGRVLGALQAAGSLGRLLGPVLGGALYARQFAGFAPAAGQGAFWSGAILVAAALAAVMLAPAPRAAVATRPPDAPPAN